MATQERAIRTRRKILEAAASVFERRGYEGATIMEVLQTAGLTKGALYFHFESKEALALGVLAAQNDEDAVQPQPIKLQELADSGFVLAERLRTDPLVRASIRLTLDQQARGLDQRGPFMAWTEANRAALDAARENGELLPYVDTQETAELCVGTFAGLQLMSLAISDYADLPQRLSAFLRHFMPSVAVPTVLAALDFSPTRGRHLIEQAAARAGAATTA